jgi:hypothetical protein
MNEKSTQHMESISYYRLYHTLYAPQLMEADILLKSMEQPLTVEEAAEALCLPVPELREAMAHESVRELDKDGLLAVLSHGGGAFALLKRARSLGARDKYRPSDIAYIYGLNEQTVRAVFSEWGLAEIPARWVPALLKKIWVLIIYS